MGTRVDYAREAQKLKPYILEWVRQVSSSGVLSSSGGSTLSSHRLDDTSIHVGSLLQSQAPWAVSYSDFNAHTSNPDAHHARATVGQGLIISGQQLSLNPLVADAGLTYTTGKLAVGAGLGITVNADDVALTTPGTLSVSSSNSATGSHTHAVSASSDVRSGVTALLKSASGSLSVDILNAGTQVWSPVLTYNGDLAITPTGNVTLTPGGGSVLVAQSDALRSDNYLAGFPMAGFRIGPTALSGQSGVEAGIGLFDELRARIFVADETRVDRGQEYITKSYGILSRNFTTPSTIDGTEFVFFENSPHIVGALFTDGDWVMFRYLNMDGGGLLLTSAWGQVYNYLPNPSGADASEQRWTFFLRRGTQFDAVAPNSSVYGLIFRKGAMAVNFGASEQGYILSDAVTATSPFVQIGKWTGNPYTPANRTVHTQIGRLDGVGFTGEHGLYAGTGPGTGDAFIVVSDLGQRLNNLTVRTYLSGTQTGFWGADGIFYLGTNVGAAATRGFSYNPNTNVLLVGRSTEANLYYDANGLKIRQGADTVIALNSDGRSEFAGEMTIGTNGGIWQGEGTFASPTTGLKIWNQSGVGLIAGYNGGVAQWYANTDGKLYAGDGAVVLDASGITVLAAAAVEERRSYSFSNATGTFGGLEAFTSGLNDVTLRVKTTGNYQPRANIVAQGTATYAGYIGLQAVGGAGNVLLTMQSELNRLSITAGTTYFSGAVETTSTLAVNTSGTNGKFQIAGDVAEVGYTRTAAGAAVIHLHSEIAVTASYPDYNTRLLQNSGADGSAGLYHRGTGNLDLYNYEAAAIRFVTSNTLRAHVGSDGPLYITRAAGLSSVKSYGASSWLILDAYDANGMVGLGYYNGADVSLANGGGNVGIGNDAPTARLHVSGDILCQYIRCTVTKTPTSSADSSGAQGEIRYDTNYIYIRTGSANPYWKRAALSTW